MRPAKGTAAAERQQRRAAIVRAERKAKLAAKERDSLTCRRCGYTHPYGFTHWNELDRVEAAHLRSKGHGGDGGVFSSSPADYVTLCHECHQGPRSLHSGHVRVEFGPAGGDGPVTFIDQQPGARHGRCAVDGAVHREGPHCRGFRPQ